MAERTLAWRRWLLLPPLALGVAILAWQASQRPEPARAPSAEPARPVRVVQAIRTDVTPRADGYGPVQPARVWKAVAQVAGRVVEMADDLGNGSVVTAGTPLLRIDPVDYELALARIEAELGQLGVEEDNARASLAIERRVLELAEREFRRIEQLVQRGTAAQSQLDAAEREWLAARGRVQTLDNTLALVPPRRDVLDARREQALRDIANTRITAPFDLRVAALAVETGQFVNTGQVLLQGDSVGRAEVVAQVSIASLRKLVLDRDAVNLTPGLVARSMPALAGFSPTIEMDLGDVTATWNATFVRISDAVDAKTRTVGVVVAVDDPFAMAIPGKRPPLTRGMFVRVAIRGEPLADRVVVPRHAVRAGTVLLADDDDRLQRRAVSVAFEQQGISVIDSGLDGGERVVVTDVVPLVEGMRLDVSVDDELSSTLRAAGADPR